MDEVIEQISSLLREAAETHHKVYRITDGAHDDWASWYADWLAHLSELPDLLPKRPVRSELTAQLVALEREHATTAADEPWDRFYAERLVRHFS